MDSEEESAMSEDPVCEMAVEAEHAVSLQRDGRAFYFCSADRRWEFGQSPARFAAGGAAVNAG